MSLVTVLKSFVEQIKVNGVNMNFAFGSDDFKNLLADNQTGATAYLDAPIKSSGVINKGGFINDTYPVRIMFSEQAPLDALPEDLETIKENMRSAANKLIAFCLDSEDINNVSDRQKKSDFENAFDANLCGTILEFEVDLSTYPNACIS